MSWRGGGGSCEFPARQPWVPLQPWQLFLFSQPFSVKLLPVFHHEGRGEAYQVSLPDRVFGRLRLNLSLSLIFLPTGYYQPCATTSFAALCAGFPFTFAFGFARCSALGSGFLALPILSIRS